jgi:hypothetical protein
MYSSMSFDSVDRKTLQLLAKKHGVKANLSNARIIDELNSLNISPPALIGGAIFTEEMAVQESYDDEEDRGDRPTAIEETTRILSTTIETAEEQDHEVAAAKENISLSCTNVPAEAEAANSTPLKQKKAQAESKSTATVYASKDTSSKENATWKPRAMPNFKALHEKFPIVARRDTPTKNRGKLCTVNA